METLSVWRKLLLLHSSKRQHITEKRTPENQVISTTSRKRGTLAAGKRAENCGSGCRNAGGSAARSCGAKNTCGSYRAALSLARSETSPILRRCQLLGSSNAQRY
jgi:hypothetical protein